MVPKMWIGSSWRTAKRRGLGLFCSRASNCYRQLTGTARVWSFPLVFPTHGANVTTCVHFLTGRNINITIAIKKIRIFLWYICCRDRVFPIFAETSASLVSPDLLPLLLDAWTFGKNQRLCLCMALRPWSKMLEVLQWALLDYKGQ